MIKVKREGRAAAVIVVVPARRAGREQGEDRAVKAREAGAETRAKVVERRAARPAGSGAARTLNSYRKFSD